jgi:signal transduction histidine kinase
MAKKPAREALQLENEKLKAKLKKKSASLKRMSQDLEIEESLERMRKAAMAMRNHDDLQGICVVLFEELKKFGFKDLRNTQVIITHDDNETFTDFDYSDYAGGSKTRVFYSSHIKTSEFIKEIKKADDAFAGFVIAGDELEDWRNWRKQNGEADEPKLSEIDSLHYYFYSIGRGAIGISAFKSISNKEQEILKRFRNVFGLAYRRYMDVSLAESQAEQAKLDLIKLQTEKKRAEEALKELKSAQTQLIQAEKMASLGELTAGIAHEIQNPLNFVNNFSEVSNELIDEMNAEIEKGDMDEARVIATDIKQNLEKITYHGKRADAIVKSMLMHSRSSSGLKEPTDINALADEYLRLAYHGLRAKEMSFNATLKTDFDSTLGKIELVAQDMGRVILNLITNAFYAVSEKMKSGIENYEPTISLSTKKLNGFVEITVADNGNGIPPKVLDKIFQPFFTTKPTGQGTGLGLSLSYDIVKAHEGELRVQTREGEGTQFTIQIPAV